MVAVTGALEVTVHGWDIAAACGASCPVPPGLAAFLLPIAPLLITPGTRPGLFADAAASQVESLGILINNAGIALYDDLGDRSVLRQHLTSTCSAPTA